MPYIVTHHGPAHFDDYLATSLALYLICGPRDEYALSIDEVDIYRRNPTDEELADHNAWVLDVGEHHEPENSNFDHHGLSQDCCAYSLLNETFELGLEIFDWYEAWMILDHRGPNACATSLGLDRFPTELMSPLLEYILEEFSSYEILRKTAGQMRIKSQMLWFATRLVGKAKRMKELRDELEEELTVWIPARADGQASIGLVEVDPVDQVEWLCRTHGLAILVMPDNRGPGWTIYRYNDHPAVDCRRIESDPRVTFAHHVGFIAKTSEVPAFQALWLASQTIGN